MLKFKKRLTGITDASGHTLTDDEEQILADYRTVRAKVEQAALEMKSHLYNALNK
jgi:hypothetical protein